MLLPVPVLLLTGPLLAGGVTAVFRRWPRVAGLLGALLAFALWRWLVAAPAVAGGSGPEPLLFAGDEWVVLGRLFLLTPGLRLLLGGLTTAVALLCLLTVLVPQGAQFATVTLLLLSPLAAALMVRPFGFGVVALMAATALLAVLIQGDRAGSTLAAMRFLALMGVSMPLVLAAEWMLASGQTALLAGGSRLMLIGLIIWLAGFPAHIWLAPLLDEAPPLVAVVAAALLPVVLVVLAQQILVQSTPLLASPAFLAVLRLSGSAVVVVGGGLALLSRGAGRLLADLLLLDVGALLLVFGLGDSSLATPLVMLGARFVGLLLAATGLALLRRAGPGQMQRAPAATALFVAGAVSLLGLPLTPGFFGRWTAVNVAATTAPVTAILLLLGTIAGTVGLLRWLARAWAVVDEEDIPGRETAVMRWAVAVVLLLVMGAALWPRWWVDGILSVAALL